MTTKGTAMPNSGPQHRNDEGFAMAIVISVVLIMFIMLAAVTLPLSADVQSSIRLGKVANERQLAESVMNELFSQAAKSSDLNREFRMVGRVDPSLPGLPRSVDDAGDTAGWAKYVPATGSFEACGSITELCFFYSPQLKSGSPFVTVEVTTRSACRTDKTSCVFRRFQQTWRRRGFVDYVIFTDTETLQPELYGTGLSALVVRRGTDPAVPVDIAWAQNHCGNRLTEGAAGVAGVFTTPTTPVPVRDGYEDNSRRQTNAAAAADYYLWPHRPSNDPLQGPIEGGFQPEDRRHENCFEIAYTGAVGDLDKVRGPIHTNDYWFWYCGSPEFSDKVEATGDPHDGTVFRKSTMSGCVANGSPTGVGGAPLTAASVGPFLKLPDKLDIYATLAAPENTFSPSVGRTVKILMVGDGTMRVTKNGATPALTDPALVVPKRGVVRVPSNNPTPGPPLNPPNVLEIQGVGSDVTFVSEDDLKVTGEIKQPLNTPGVTLGFVAGGSITINQPDRFTVPRAMDLTVEGAFLSLKGMSVQDWNLASDAGQPHPTLHLTGAIIAKYRPVFGTYDKDGVLQSGMRKDIRYPVDSKADQIPPTPPYFVQPVNAVWVRLDFSETPLLAGSPGLTKAPTSPPGTAAAPGTCDPTWGTNNPATGYVPICLINP
jgi:hypothetical protein